MNQRLEHSQQQLQLIQIKADENTRSLSSQLDKVTAEVRLTSELARIDTRRLLQICAGLQVGIERIEKRQRFQPRKTQDSRPRRIARTEHQTSSLQRDARSLKWSLQLTTHTVSQLLQRFSNLSKEILEYSKNIYMTNIEIYALLRRMQDTPALSPQNIPTGSIIVHISGREYRLPYSYFCYWDVFEAMLKCESKGQCWERHIDAGFYGIVTRAPGARSSPDISRASWHQSISPGIKLYLSIVATHAVGQECRQSGCRKTWKAISLNVRILECEHSISRFLHLLDAYPVGIESDSWIKSMIAGRPLTRIDTHNSLTVEEEVKLHAFRKLQKSRPQIITSRYEFYAMVERLVPQKRTSISSILAGGAQRRLEAVTGGQMKTVASLLTSRIQY
ncbi:hypothetical protein EV356DRAFT_293355 [Viridothelium virens]|uniref:Ubiquitin-like domain-containing protein n=1 Tax=Viridothelium virens TaxID=1048519 RepID=A0A6A6H075_VIRVR|nr:hypothetical protein EV356DRAFT_293355 [Viridothelium virens]